MASLDILSVDQDIVEVLIAVTILITALQNIIIPKPDTGATRLKYAAALFFGLIHGLGFSSYFKALLSGESIVGPLFSFNVGIEAGQLIIVAAMMLFFLIAEKGFKAKPRDWNLFFSGMAFGVALIMIMERVTG